MIRKAWRSLRKLRKASQFVPLSDLGKFYRLLSEDDRSVVGLRILPLNLDEVFARTGSEDHATLSYVFLDRYHLPPTQLPDAPTILDLGSNCGYTIVHYKHLYPAARIIGVEMDAGNFALARRNVDGHERVDLLHAAVSHLDGTAAYSTLNKEDAYHIVSPTADATGEFATVATISIRSLMQRYGLSHVDFVKMDIEGEELNIFAPGSDLDWLDTVRSMNIEVHGEPSVLDAILQLLHTHNFRAWKDDRHWSAVMAVRRS